MLGVLTIRNLKGGPGERSIRRSTVRRDRLASAPVGDLPHRRARRSAGGGAHRQRSQAAGGGAGPRRRAARGGARSNLRLVLGGGPAELDRRQRAPGPPAGGEGVCLPAGEERL